MYSLVDVERGFLRKALVTDIALEWAFPGVRAHVYLQVRLASERGRTLGALVRPPLDCDAITRQYKYGTSTLHAYVLARVLTRRRTIVATTTFNSNSID